MQDFLELSTSRYTTKHYDRNKKISKEDFLKLCEIMRLAPSSVNIQPWHFFASDLDKEKQRLLPAIADFNRERFAYASHFIVCCVKTCYTDEDLETLTDQEIADGRYTREQAHDMVKLRYSCVHGLHQTGGYLDWAKQQLHFAVTALVYGAAQMGIDSTIMGGADFGQIDKILGLEGQKLTSVLVVSLGYRAQDDANASRPKSRLPLDKIFTFLD